MKRTISLVIALTLSFAMMFGSIAKAEEIKVPISVSALEPNKLEAVKVPAAKTNKADCLLAQAKAKVPMLENEDQTSKQETDSPTVKRCGECKTEDGFDGMLKRQKDGSEKCEQCHRVQCGACQVNGGCGRWQGNQCVTCEC